MYTHIYGQKVQELMRATVIKNVNVIAILGEVPCLLLSNCNPFNRTVHEFYTKKEITNYNNIFLPNIFNHNKFHCNLSIF